MVLVDGYPAEIAYPILAIVVSRMSDSVRKGPRDPQDWPDLAKGKIAALNEAELRGLVADLMRLREETELDQRRVVSGLGWSGHAQRATGDDPMTFLQLIEFQVHAEQQKEHQGA